MHDPLRASTSRAHRELAEQMAGVTEAVRERTVPHAVVEKTDAFMIHTCRHVHAVCHVILPVARMMLPDGEKRVREYVRQVRRLEHSVALTKRRLYGESHTAHLPWSQVWSGLDRELVQLMVLERSIVADVAEIVGPRVGGHFASRIAVSEACSPTRPHPHSPLTGRLAPLSRRLWGRADSFWDHAEGRIVAGAVKVFKAPARLAS